MFVKERPKIVDGKKYVSSAIGKNIRVPGKKNPKFIKYANITNLPELEKEKIKHALGKNKISLDIDKISLEDIASVGDKLTVEKLVRDTGIFNRLNKMEKDGKEKVTELIWGKLNSATVFSKAGICRKVNSEKKGWEYCRGKFQKDRYANEYYRCMDELLEYKSKLEKMFAAKYLTDGDIAYYDLTTFYFEGTHAEIGEKGKGKDGKRGHKIIQAGILCNKDGGLINIEVYPGKTSEQTTLIDRLNELKNKYKLKDIIVIADRGIINSARKKEVEKAGFKYIRALKRNEIITVYNENPDEHEKLRSLFDQKVDVIEIESGNRYVVWCNEYKANYVSKQRRTKQEKIDKKLKGIQKRIKNKQLKKAEAITKSYACAIQSAPGLQKYIKIKALKDGVFEYKWKEEKMFEDEATDGCTMIETQIEKSEASTEEVKKKYMELGEVERVIRMLKTIRIGTRPIFHRKENRIRGHLFLCYLSYNVWHEFKKRAKDFWEARHKKSRAIDKQESWNEIWEILKEIHVGTIDLGCVKTTQVEKLTKSKEEVVKYLGINIKNVGKKILS